MAIDIYHSKCKNKVFRVLNNSRRICKVVFHGVPIDGRHIQQNTAQPVSAEYFPGQLFLPYIIMAEAVNNL